MARPRAVEAPDRVDDAVAARLHKGLGRQIARIIQVIQVSLIRRHSTIMAIILIDLVQEPRLEVHYCGLRAHVATAAKYRLISEPVPLGPAPTISNPAPIKGAVANPFERPVPVLIKKVQLGLQFGVCRGRREVLLSPYGLSEVVAEFGPLR